MSEKEQVLALREREQLIPYRALPIWVEPIARAVCLVSALLIMFMPFSLAAIIWPGAILPHALFVIAETFIRVVAIMLVGVLCYFSYELARQDYLVINKSNITFPVFLAPDLLFKRKRSWDDVANVLLGAYLLEDKLGTYEYDLEEAKDKKRLFIYFKSGGHVSLDLNRMPKNGGEALFAAIESWCISFTRAPVPRPEGYEKQKKKAKQQDSTKALTYTQMWEDEMQMHFSATNFVPLEKGDTLQDGKYKILMQLSSGGLSAVYLAETAAPNKPLVVLKEASLPHSLEEKSRAKAKELFHREATILRELDHMRIAKVLDCFLERSRDYLVIEFIPGETLRQLVKKSGIQSERTVLKIALQSAQILSYLHSRKPRVIHRDITPDNLIVKEGEHVVLIDFGAANQYLGTATGTLIGQQCYIAPEQFRGQASERSDLYSLGCTMYYLLTGEDPEALSTSHPQSLRPEISDAMDKLVAELTAFEAKERLPSAVAVISRITAMIPDTVLSMSGAEKQ